MSPNWGEVWWVELPHTLPRPGLILTRPEAIPVLPVVLVAPATTTIRGLPTEVIVDEEDGIPRRSAINLDTPELVPRGSLTAYVTALTAGRMREVCERLALAVNCASLVNPG